MNIKKPVIENHLSDRIPKWFAIYTRYKAEKDVAHRLNQKGITCYVPINRVVRQYRRKRKIVELPLINCYAFVHITKDDYISVLETQHVSRFIAFSRNLISIPDEEIQLLQRVCQEAENIETDMVTFQKWKTVEIIGGNLTGVRGKLLDCRGKNFLIELDHVGVGMRIEVEQHLLRSIKGRVLEMSDQVAETSVGRRYWF